VVAVRSVHLTRDRAAANAPFTVDDALVDVGAASGAAARAGGIAVLAPVAREKQPISYGDGRLAAPWAGRRSACAALAVAAAGSRPTGRVVVAFVVEDRLGARGLRTVLNLFGPFDRSVLLDGVAGELGGLVAAGDPVAQRRLPALGVASHLSLPVRYPGTPVETVSLGDVERLADSLGAMMGGAR
jgi:putative aminopeptidase FrvX